MISQAYVTFKFPKYTWVGTVRSVEQMHAYLEEQKVMPKIIDVSSSDEELKTEIFMAAMAANLWL